MHYQRGMKKEEYFKEIEHNFYSSDNIDVATGFYESVLNSIGRMPSQALEVGCGYGLAASIFVENIDVLRLYDIDRTALEFVRWKFGYKVLALSELKYEREDALIYFFLSLHHIDDYKTVLNNAISHIERYGGAVAVCEFAPSDEYVFHRNEPSPYDGLRREAFDWIRELHPNLRIDWYELPDLNSHGNVFTCYSFIVRPQD